MKTVILNTLKGLCDNAPEIVLGILVILIGFVFFTCLIGCSLVCSGPACPI